MKSLSEINLDDAVNAFWHAFGKTHNKKYVLNFFSGKLCLCKVYNKQEEDEEDKLVPLVAFHDSFAFMRVHDEEGFVKNVRMNNNLASMGYRIDFDLNPGL